MQWSFMTVDFKLGCKIQMYTYAYLKQESRNSIKIKQKDSSLSILHAIL